jgi:hypothetical protein
VTVDWTHELFEQFDLQWNLAHGPSLETLTDEEYLWEPVPGCWSIRPTGPGGRGEFEQAWPGWGQWGGGLVTGLAVAVEAADGLGAGQDHAEGAGEGEELHVDHQADGEDSGGENKADGGVELAAEEEKHLRVLFSGAVVMSPECRPSPSPLIGAQIEPSGPQACDPGWRHLHPQSETHRQKLLRLTRWPGL